MTTVLYPPHPVAISVSDTPDADRLGVFPDHAWDVLIELTTELLSSGVDLAYGGDLRQGGFTEALMVLAARYQRRGQPLIRMTNYLAWPVHIRMSTTDLAAVANGASEVARLVLMGPDGCPLPAVEREALCSYEPSDEEWQRGLTDMRMAMLKNTSARIVVAGQVDNYRGRMPGVAEEVLLSLESQQPVYLVGGAGGCTRDIAESIGLVEPLKDVREWCNRHLFESYSLEALNNGLKPDENRLLAHTPFIEQAVDLVMLGLYRLYRRNGRGIFSQQEA